MNRIQKIESRLLKIEDAEERILEGEYKENGHLMLQLLEKIKSKLNKEYEILLY